MWFRLLQSINLLALPAFPECQLRVLPRSEEDPPQSDRLREGFPGSSVCPVASTAKGLWQAPPGSSAGVDTRLPREEMPAWTPVVLAHHPPLLEDLFVPV